MSEKSVLIVGATGGLGLDVVQAFVTTELKVHFTGRRSESVADLEKQVPQAVGHAVDAVEESAIRGVIEQIDTEAPLAAYVHLAGGYAGGAHIDELSPDDWEKMMDCNWLTLLHGASAAFRIMRRRKAGSIVTIGSLAGLHGGVGNAPYAVSKAAVISLTRCLAEEGKKCRVRANCIVPGILNTPANRKAMPDANIESWTQTSDVAQTIVYLCSPDAAGVNGSVLMMKAGI
jgi:NAD(P)-dependent dehydrogenase (short-subunit alcohol dehydrogenase family)